MTYELNGTKNILCSSCAESIGGISPVVSVWRTGVCLLCEERTTVTDVHAYRLSVAEVAEVVLERKKKKRRKAEKKHAPTKRGPRRRAAKAPQAV